MLPPPSPIENRSGMRNSVRTSPISTTELAARGKPRRNCPTSVDVPPTSTTIASSRPDRKAAPRMELVAPEAKLMTGNAVAVLADITVPSFWVMNSGASIPLAAIASRKPAMVTRARSVSHIKQSRVLALQQTDAAEFMRQRDAGLGALLGQDRTRALLMRGSSGEKAEAIATVRH